MKKSTFLELVQGTWTAGTEVARELSMHIPESEAVLGWLCLKRRVVGGEAWSDGDTQVDEWFAIVTDRFCLITHGQQREGKAPSVSVESAPLGRLRSVRTRSHSNGSGGLILDFAGPVFSIGPESRGNQDEVSCFVEAGWPSDEVHAFLTAVTQARR